MKNIPEVVIGVDPGAKGGIAVLDRNGDLLEVHQMPLTAEGKADASALLLLFDRDPSPALIIIEKVGPSPAWSRASIWTFARNVEAVISACDIGELKYDDKVTPQAWKKAILAGTKKQKADAISHVHKRYPAWKETVGDDDGLCDAICIGEYGVRVLLSNGDSKTS